MEATGIVCGVAGRLAQGWKRELGEGVDVTFLSTALAGTVLVRSEELERAVGALEEGMREGVGEE